MERERKRERERKERKFVYFFWIFLLSDFPETSSDKARSTNEGDGERSE